MADGRVVIETALDSKGFEKGVKSLSGKAKSGMSGFVKGALGAGVAIALLKKTVGSLISDMDKTNAAWKTFGDNMKAAGHSTKEIQRAKKDMQDFSAKSIYYSSEMAATYAQLDAVGIKSTGNIVKGFGAVAAASENPRQAMKTVSQQATQMAAKPKVAWMDFKLMMEQTPAGIAQVAKVMGKSTKQLVSEVQEGKVKTQDFFNAIAKIGGNPKHQLMKMATTYKTVGEAANGVTGTLMTRLAPAYKVVSKAAISALTDMMGKIGKIDGDALARKVESGIKKAKPVIGDFISIIKTLAGVVKTVGTPLLSMGLGILKIAATSPKATTAVLGMVGAFKGFKKAKSGFDIAKTTIGGYSNLAKAIFDVSSAKHKMASATDDALESLWILTQKSNESVVAENLKAAGYEKSSKALTTMQKGLDAVSTKLGLTKTLTISSVAPMVALTAGLTACGIAIYKNVQANHKWTASVEKARSVADDRVKSAEGEIKTIDFYKNQLVSLMSKEHRTAEDKQRIIHCTKQLNGLVPTLSAKYNTQTDNLNQTIKAIDAKIEARKREIKAEIYAKNLKDSYAKEASLEKDKQEQLDLRAKYKKQMSDAEAQGGATMQNAKYAEASKNLEQVETRIKDISKAQAQNSKDSRYWADKLSGVSGNIKQTMTAAARHAKNAGIKIPKAVASGIRAGRMDVATAQKEINAAVKFNSLVAKAKRDGVKIPQGLKNGIASGKMLPSEGVKRVNALIKGQTGKAGAPAKGHGRKVSTGMASGISGMAKTAVGAAKAMVSRVKAQGKDTYGSGQSSGSNFSRGFVNGIASFIDDAISAAKRLVGEAIRAARKKAKERSPSRVMKASGKNFGLGYAIGISSTRKRVAKSARGLAHKAIKSASSKKGLRGSRAIGTRFARGVSSGIASHKRKVAKSGKSLIKSTISAAKKSKGNYADIGNKFTDGISKSISKNNSKSKKAFGNYIDKVVGKVKNKKAKKSARKAAQAVKKAFSDALSSGGKLITNKAKKRVQKLSEEYQSSYDDLINKRKTMRENLAHHGELFEKTEGNLQGLGEINGASINGALKRNLKALKKYQTQIFAVKKKVPDDLMKEILGMGVDEANRYMRKLLKMNSKRFDEYIGNWKSQQKQVKNIENKFYKSSSLTDLSGQVADLKKYGASLEKLRKKGAPKSLLEEITSMGIEDASAYMDKLLALSGNEFDKYIKLWNQKQALATSISNKYYASELSALKNNYQTKIRAAMKSIQKEMATLGKKVMIAFCKGAKSQSKNTVKTVRSIVGATVGQTKKKATKKASKKKKKKKSKKKTAKKKPAKKAVAKKAQAKSNSASFASRFRASGMNVGKVYAKAAQAVNREVSKAPAAAKVQASKIEAKNEAGKEDALVLHSHLHLEGREVARSTVRYTDEELAEARKIKERGA